MLSIARGNDIFAFTLLIIIGIYAARTQGLACLSSNKRGYSSACTRLLGSASVRKGNSGDLPNAAQFLADWMYAPDVSPAQRRELTRLELVDLRDRYGSPSVLSPAGKAALLRNLQQQQQQQKKTTTNSVSKNQRGRSSLSLSGSGIYPSALFVVEEDGELLGCVGVDCQLLDLDARRFRKLREASDFEPGVLVPVLANLAVRADCRKRGLGRQLVQACEQFTKESGFDELYLLVDEMNKPAQRLYQRLGFKKLYRDEEATAIVSTYRGLRTEPCVNLCYSKRLTANSFGPWGSNGNSGIFGGIIQGLFNSSR